MLRGLVHSLDPAVYIGKNDLTDNVIKEMNLALEAHELVKVKVQEGCLTDIRELANDSARELNAEVVQIIGRKFSLYRPSKKRLIVLK